MLLITLITTNTGQNINLDRTGTNCLYSTVSASAISLRKRQKKITERSKNSIQQFKNRPQQCLIFRGKNRQQAVEKTKKFKYLKDAQLLKLINLADNKDFLADNTSPTRTDYVE